MVIGRVIFGIGGESVSVIQSSITTMIFKDQELSFALGMNLCIARLGSVANSVLTPKLITNVNFHAAVWYYNDDLRCGTLSCYISFIASFFLVRILKILDKKNNGINARPLLNDLRNTEYQPLLRDERDCINEEPEAIKNISFLNIFNLPRSFWIVCFVINLFMIDLYLFVWHSCTVQYDSFRLLDG